MVSPTYTSFNAEDRSYFAILKKEIHVIATNAGFNDVKTGEIDIIVAEMSSNLIKHGGGGEILVGIVGEGDNIAIEIISIDNGVGIPDVNKVLEDGYSTSNTLGHGLGAIKRFSDTFQIYSIKDWGTIVLSRVYKSEVSKIQKNSPVEIKSLVVAKPGESVSGDGAAYILQDNCLKVFLGDGLGHGKDAHEAVSKAIERFQSCEEDSPVEILRAMHTDVKKTRGLVGTAAVFNFKEKIWRICGIGNISTKTFTLMSVKNSLSYNGIIGMNIPNTLKEQIVEYFRGQLLVMCSDGIKSRWDMQKYVGIQRCDLTVAAAAIYKDYARKTDDMSVLVGKIN